MHEAGRERNWRWAVAAILAVLGMAAGPSGCKRSHVERTTEPVETTVQVGALPEPPKTTTAPAGVTPPAPPWHRELLTGEDARPAVVVEMPGVSAPDPKSNATEGESKAPESEAPEPRRYGLGAAGLLDEIRAGVEAKRTANARWNLLRLELSARGPRGHAVLQVLADVGLSTLYAKRSEIVFERMRLEECLTRLAKMAGLRYAQTARVQNPLITWRRENESVYTAVETLATEHGFTLRYSGTGTRLTYEPKDYESREKLVAAVLTGIFKQAGKIEKDIPVLIVTPKIAPPTPPADEKGKEKGAPEKAAPPKSNAPAPPSQ
jgi:hypothetical protein